MSRGLGAFWGLLFATIAVTHAATAQAPAPAAPPPRPPLPVVPVVIQSWDHPDAIYDLSYASGPPFARCTGSCSFYGYPASYQLRVSGPGYLQGTRSFELSGPSRVQISPRTEGTRSAGLVLGVIGLSLLTAGATLALVGETTGDTNTQSVTLLGLGMCITGAILTPIGFVRYGRTSPGISVEPL